LADNFTPPSPPKKGAFTQLHGSLVTTIRRIRQIPKRETSSKYGKYVGNMLNTQRSGKQLRVGWGPMTLRSVTQRVEGGW